MAKPPTEAIACIIFIKKNGKINAVVVCLLVCCLI